MLDVILNEKKVIEDFKTQRKLPNDITWGKMVNLLIKNYYLEGKNKDEIYKCIIEDIQNTLQNDFVYTKWNNMVKSNITRFNRSVGIYSINIELFDVKEIRITNNELEKIRELNDVVLEKIAFIILVYAKISNLQNKNNDYWINQSCITICKEANVGLRGVEQMRKMNDLYMRKYIDMSKINTRTNIKVCFVDSEYILFLKSFVLPMYTFPFALFLIS